ncbi:MAG: hypothetical protein R3D00_21390 [Bacteroidia bacterium]
MNNWIFIRRIKREKKLRFIGAIILILFGTTSSLIWMKIVVGKKSHYQENRLYELPLKDILKNTLVNCSKKFPNEKVFAVCITKTNLQEIKMHVISLPPQESSIYSTPTPHYLYDSTGNVLFLFYSGLESITKENDITIKTIYSTLIPPLALIDDWDENTRQIKFIGTYHEVCFQIEFTLDGNILIEPGDPLSSCLMPPTLTKEFQIPIP